MKISNKILFLSVAVMTFISLSSCNKIKDAIHADVDIDQASIDITIPPIATTEEGKIAGADNISAVDLSEYKGLKSVTLKSIKVELKEQDPEANFKALEKVSVEISSAGLETKVIAGATNTDFVTNKYTLNIPVSGANIDIRNFVKNTFSYTIKGKAHSKTTKAIPATITAVYTVRFGL
ncbi:hypothetical protein BCY91_12120 [Pelobium manganitolerans]|uniref:Uncharacterized protein n=1 Tax=Pelobium manganitolerans TaxID=1842495 RepID=A0A419S1M0_9SPHI|nr:hypothetical protein [Pelobium manganitolerans]RKD12389.1 hypothetical protein BCY91_12120 [Pelobium manganitolerans]